MDITVAAHVSVCLPLFTQGSSYRTNLIIIIMSLIPKYLNQIEAIKLDSDLFGEYKYNVSQLMELAGLSVAQAIAKSYPLSKYNKPIICCGPGNNGGDGLVCARHLKLFGYSPIVIYPKTTNSELYSNLLKQCEGFDMKIIKRVPDETLEDLGNIVIDCIFGFSFKPPNRNEDFAKLLNMIHISSKKLPLVSVDIPSGWHVESGTSCIVSDQADLTENLKIPILEPDCLISLTAPKLCAKQFKGRYHYLGGRFCPPSLLQKYNLTIPEYPGIDEVILLNKRLPLQIPEPLSFIARLIPRSILNRLRF